ncbi:hypothetical protein C9374_014050 [Naegleria lovaniensis]|uniref:Uncharacterized protein n=1 Tax=Naegleria lovaniensis TaxID=51637 RepID=A0AA88GYP5_NAELO|nr:uncharacterized protein C9374_014050 [Naegleria lovaniensis]KAG2389490.1 hypothetical protein C9374_014050 [Naegleria lovaniensis]
MSTTKRHRKPPLHPQEPYDPYKLYEQSFKQKGQGRYVLYKTYNLGMLWCSLTFGFFALDAFNPSHYVSVRLNISDQEAQAYDDLFDYPLRIASMVTTAIAFALSVILLLWFSMRRSIYSNIHYVLHFGTLCGLVLSSLVQYLSIIVFYMSMNDIVVDNVKMVYTFRIICGVALAVHELCAYKLLSEMCETNGSSPGVILSFALTSRSFKFAFDEIISLQDWITPAQVMSVLLYLGFIVIISVISYTSLEIYQYLQNHPSLFDSKKQTLELLKHQMYDSKRTFVEKIKQVLKRNLAYLLMMTFLLCMTALFWFGVRIMPLNSGGWYWAERVNVGVNDIISLRLAIHFLILVTLPFFGALFDQGGKNKEQRKKELQLLEIRENKKTSIPESSISHKRKTSFVEKIAKSFRLKFRIVLLCLGMMVAIGSSFFYTIESPQNVPLYDFSLNIVTFIHSIGTAMATSAIHLIPKYYFSVINKDEIEEKATYLKRRYYKNTPQYLFYLHNIFYEQTEFTGVRYLAWYSLLSTVKNISLLYHMYAKFRMNVLITAAVLIFVLSLIAFLVLAVLSYVDFKYVRERTRNQHDASEQTLETPLISSTQEEQLHDHVKEMTSSSKFDPSSLFTKHVIRFKGCTRFAVAVLTWPIDVLMTANMTLFITCLCGAPTIMLSLYEALEPSNRQSSHPVEIVFLCCLFVLFLFSFLFVYKTTFLKFMGLHFFKWTRRLYNLIFDSPYSTISGYVNGAFSFAKYESRLMEMKKKRERKATNNSVPLVKTLHQMIDPGQQENAHPSNWDLHSEENDGGYYVSYELMSTKKNSPSLNNDHNLVLEEEAIDSKLLTLADEVKQDDYVIVTTKDDRVFPYEDLEDNEIERVKIQHFKSKEDYVNYLNSSEFLQRFNERDYSFTRITNGTVLFKKSKYKHVYTNERNLKYIRSIRPGSSFTLFVISYFCGYFLIPQVFSWFKLAPIPIVSNPYTFLIVTCNFIFGFLMFYPLVAVWMDVNQSITSSLKEAIVMLEDTKAKLQIHHSSENIEFDPKKQVKIKCSKDQFYLFDVNMITQWYKNMTFIQKTVDAKMSTMKHNLVIVFVLAKAGSVVLSLISLFTNIEFTPQNFQPMYIVLGLDLAVLFFVIDPCATLYFFLWKNIITMLKMRTKVTGLINNYPQENKEQVNQFAQTFHYIQYWNELQRMQNMIGCRFDIHGYLFLTIDQNMYKNWFYSLLATLPPAIVKLIIQKFFTTGGFFKI